MPNDDGSYPDASCVVIDPKTSDVLALIGGIGKKEGNRIFNRATQAKRAPGSVIKPLSVYAPLIEDNLNVKIYDEAIEIAYAANNSEYSKTHSKAPSNNVLAKVTFTDLEEVEQTFYLTVTKDEELEGNTYSAWDYLELTAGATTAIDLLSTKIIKQTDAYKAGCTDEEYDDYKYQLELMLTSFASGSYSSYGYDASIGKYTQATDKYF